MDKKFITPGRVKQVNATILAPENAGLRIVLNLCNQDGKFEKPLDSILTKKWAKVREDYKGWYATQNNFKLGALNTTAVSSDVWVVSALVRNKEGNVDLNALQLAIKNLTSMAKYENASVHVSELLTAEVPSLKELLVNSLAGNGTHVYFYVEPVKARS